ncbi:MAG: sensor histidine kinase [Cytophagaceae bacterium]
MNKYHEAKGTFIPDQFNSIYSQVINEIKDYAIFMMDREGKITTWNEGCIRIKQYKADETVGKYYDFLFIEEDQKSNKPQQELDHASKHGRYESEFWRRKKDGSLFWAHVVLTAIHDNDGKVIGFTKITGDLTDKKKKEDELYQRTEQLIKINADLENFVLSASHDLKGPLANIEGLVNNLDQELTEDEYQEIKEMLKLSVKKFQTTLNELTNIAHQQKKQFELKTEEQVSFLEVLEDVRYSIADEVADTCPDIKTEFSIPQITFSKVALRSIIHNLITNSIKYRDHGRDCQITVKSEKENNNIILTVKDNGMGMKPGYKENVFQKYHRLEENTEGIEGTGVGLYLVKRIVDSTNGKIEVESTLGVGSTFRIIFPIN